VADPVPDAPVPGAAAGLPVGDVLAGATVVVIDDDEINVILLEGVLREAGVGTVRRVTDPASAVDTCVALCPDLVILDLHMPGVDGLGVLERLRRELPEDAFVPVVVVTGDGRSKARDDALAAGAKDFVTKPFDPTEVVLRARNLIETRALYDRISRESVALRVELDERIARDARALEEHDRRRRQVEEALSGSTVTMAFQPITDLATDAVVGVEALARFAGPPHRPPNEWFEEAAEVGLGTELELLAVRAALSAVDRFSHEIFVSVNVSPSTTVSPELAKLVADAPAHRIVVELTEHHRIDCYDTLLEALDRLRSHGARIAVDDAGAGHAGLQHILRLHPEVLKLDMALTRGIDVDPARRALATALVHFADDIDSVIVAEGVETTEELDVLRSLAVRCAQGYLLGRPAPAPDSSRPARDPGPRGG
jgi:EAL domain-containing protein (putative c-di-GMP-specific phosphodiesterase class I)/AmiR/NasT family two-component response regulator